MANDVFEYALRLHEMWGGAVLGCGGGGGMLVLVRVGVFGGV